MYGRGGLGHVRARAGGWGVEGGRQSISIDGCTDGPRTRANVRCP